MLLGCGATETAPATVDATGDAPAETADAFDPGACGRAVFDCLCKCDGGISCQTACYDAPCLKCIDDGTTGCCPTEYPAYKACLTEATTAPDGGTAPCAKADTKCVDDRCKSQAAALQTCLATPACKGARTKCTADPAGCGH